MLNSYSKQLIILVLTLISISYAHTLKAENQPSIGKSKIENSFSPEEKIIRFTIRSKNVDERSYLRGCFRRIEQAQREYPRNKPIKGLKGSIRLSITLDYQGNLINTQTLKSSGNYLLDNYVNELVNRSAPFSQFPESMYLKAHKAELIMTIDLSNLN
jgi:TonB family protein